MAAGKKVGNAKTTAPKTTAPKTTAPKTTAPKTTAPKTTTPKTTAPKTTTPKTTTSKSGAGGRRGRIGAFSAGMRITVLVKGDNPKRGKAAKRFELYANAGTVGEYLAAGGLMADIRWDVKQGYIEVQ